MTSSRFVCDRCGRRGGLKSAVSVSSEDEDGVVGEWKVAPFRRTMLVLRGATDWRVTTVLRGLDDMIVPGECGVDPSPKRYSVGGTGSSLSVSPVYVLIRLSGGCVSHNPTRAPPRVHDGPPETTGRQKRTPANKTVLVNRQVERKRPLVKRREGTTTTLDSRDVDLEGGNRGEMAERAYI